MPAMHRREPVQVQNAVLRRHKTLALYMYTDVTRGSLDALKILVQGETATRHAPGASRLHVANLDEDGDRGRGGLLPAVCVAVAVAARRLQLPQQLVDETAQSGPICAATLRAHEEARIRRV